MPCSPLFDCRRFFLLLLLLLAGCTPPPEVPLRIGTNIWPGYKPLYLAQQLGYYGEIPIKLIEYPSSTETLSAFRNGMIDAAALTLDEALLLSSQGNDIAVVLVCDFSAGGDALLAQGDLPIRKVADLKGRRIGVETGALGAYMLTRALESGGLSARDVEVVSIGEQGHRYYFERHLVDAIVTFDPVRGQLLQQGARLLFDSWQIPGEIVDVLVVRRPLLAERQQELRQLVQAWFRALQFQQQQPEQAAQMVQSSLGLSTRETLAAYSVLHLPDLADNRLLLAEPHKGLRMTATRLQSVMLANRLLAKAATLDTLFSDRLLPQEPGQ